MKTKLIIRVIVSIVIISITTISCQIMPQNQEINSPTTTATLPEPTHTSIPTKSPTPTITWTPTVEALTTSDSCQLIPEGVCYHPLFPAIEGYVQSYRVRNLTTGEESTEVRTFGAVEINNEEEPQGQFSIELKTGEDIATIDAFCYPEGILVNETQAMAQMSDEGMGGSIGDFETKSINFNGFTYPKNLSPGDTWTQSMDWIVEMDSSFISEFMLKSVTTYTYVGTETVEVPAGTFTAHRIDMEVDFRVGPLFGGSFMQIASIPASVSLWNVECIGTVKYVYNAMDEEKVIELTDYTFP